MILSAIEGPTVAFVKPAPAPSRGEWNALVAQHQRAVLRALLARGIRLDGAKDLAQAAWAKLWERQLAGGLARLELPGLAIRQALFLAADERRAAKPLANAPADPAWDPEGRLLSRAQLRQIQGELAHAPPKVREMFALAYGGGGLSHAEIARETGVSLQHVRQSLSELRQRLRAALEMEDAP